MAVIAMLSVAPVVEGNMSGEVVGAVAALDDFEVPYETDPMGTVIEANDIGELLVAVSAAHKAVDGDRISMSLEIDGRRTKEQATANRIDAVEAHLGREARGDRE